MEENKVRYINFLALMLSAEGGTAKLRWGVRMGFPRLTVEPERINEGDSYPEKIITAPFNYIMFYYMVDRFEEIIEADPGTMTSIECKNIKYANGERTQETFVQAKVIVGKDKEGIIFISVIAEDKKKVKFNLLPDEKWYKLYRNGVEVTDRVELSKCYAKAYVRALKATYDSFRLDENINISVVDRPANGSNFRRPFNKKTTTQPTTPVQQNAINEIKIDESKLQSLSIEEKKTETKDSIDDFLGM